MVWYRTYTRVKRQRIPRAFERDPSRIPTALERRRRRWVFLLMSLLVVGVFCAIFRPPVAAADPAVTDSLYNAHHPRLLFTPGELPALRAKVADGGYDDAAYLYLRYLAENHYPALSTVQLLGTEWGLNTIPNLGVAAYLESPIDTEAIEIGRDATLYVAENYGVDDDEAGTGLRLRALTFGYDMFFGDAAESLRTIVRDEIVDYMEYMTTSLTYELFSLRPYLGNHSAMYAGPLGMAAICLEDETAAELRADAMALADAVLDSLLTHQFDPGGAFKEGVLYVAWTARQLAYYFHARKRFDGFDYADDSRIRNVERWLCYEILPEGWGKTNNLNDSPYTTTVLARHSTYTNWAQSQWNSGLSAWLWEHTAGPYGVDLAAAADKTATVLWNLGLQPVQPDSVLPPQQLWIDRGLYYYRTGWQSGASSSDDVVFSFYSGKFHGGHAQEDQNQFTLYAYGAKFAVDHGSGFTAKESESHNIVFVDGAGQHNAGSAIGTDGRIAEHLLGDFADYVLGDATAAYTTYSEFNAPDWPYPGTDWSWGYSGANPVDCAFRRVIAVHGPGTPPYFLVLDDVDKDGGPHDYQWRMHTSAFNTVDASANPIRIENTTSSSAALDLYVLYPDFASVSASTQPYNNGVPDPNSTLIGLTHNAVNPLFSMLLVPSDTTAVPPVVTQEILPWGFACVLDWGAGVSDVVIGNHTGDPVSWGSDSLKTDASAAVIRLEQSVVTRHLLVGATVLRRGGTEYVRFFDAPATCALDGDVFLLDRTDAAFFIADTGIDRILADDTTAVPFVRRSGFLVPGVLTASETPPLLNRGPSVTVYPNPFNPVATIRIDLPRKSPLFAAVFDVGGRLVKTLVDDVVCGKRTTLRWDGTNRLDKPVPSGVYFLKVTADGATATKKLTVVR